MSGVLGPYAPESAPVTPLLVLAVWFGLTGGVVSAVGRCLRRRSARRRAALLEPVRRREPAGAAASRRKAAARARSRRWRWADRELAVPLAAGSVLAVLIGGPLGLPAGALAVVGLRYWLPRLRASPARRGDRETARLLVQLPLTAELLAACLSSSASPERAVSVVAQAVGGPMRSRLAAVAAELALGAPAAACWERLGHECPALAPLARCLIRTTVSGTPPAAPLRRLAVAQRAAAARAAHARVRRAGVLATAPLGLCFLPAFVLIGVVPVVVGLASAFTSHI